ncbi:carboxypeptidase regulatory-like domain-containing protein [Thiocystis violacea]|uniref:carboxypeptidase regulatory-like domain-containing protein n=1 Tax=Thiocystis violacea TaxID=13725 RepID=UPI00190606E6|nr:carboxypeptidase regulatory-like domain-containing protein [Thiocystis violacea]MBK1718567.1 hypothetical protein [Thiocystis violacea]
MRRLISLLVPAPGVPRFIRWGAISAITALLFGSTGLLAQPTQLGGIAGTVSNSSGAPIQDIRVEASKWTCNGWEMVENARSESDGSYRIQNLSDNVYHVSFIDDQGSFNPEFYDGALGIDAATDITILSEGSVSGINAQLGPNTDTPPTGKITGTIKNSSGTPSAYANISVYTFFSSEWSYVSGTGTDENGRFELNSLPNGAYRLRIESPYEQGIPQAVEYYIGKQQVDEGSDIDVADNTFSLGEYSLQPPGSLSGTLVDQDGRPIANTNVRYALLVEYRNYDGFLTTDASGAYSLSLPRGEYKISFKSDVYQRSYYGGADSNSAVPIQVAAGEVKTGLNVTLAPGTSISGQVTDLASQPLRDINVEIFLWNENGGYWDWQESDQTDTDGRYSVDGLADGRYKLQARDWSGSYAPIYYGQAVDEASADEILLAHPNDQADIDVRLDMASKIAGRAIGFGGYPLKHLNVTAYRWSGNYWQWLGDARTDDDGVYDISGLSSGVYVLQLGCNYANNYSRYYDDEENSDDALEIVVAAQSTATQNMQLPLGWPPAPQAATDIRVDSANETSITVSWTDNSSDETGFKIYQDGQELTPSPKVSANGTTYTFSGLTCATEYRLGVRATNALGDSSIATLQASTQDCSDPDAPPAAPTGLTLTPVSRTSIRLDWTDTSSNETSFKISRNGVELNVAVSPNASSFLDSGLTCDTAYTYSVMATNGVGDSAPVSESTTTPACDDQLSYILTLNQTGDGEGEIVGNAAGPYETGTPIMLKAEPASGSEFVGWDDPLCESSFRLTRDTTCSAEFRAQPATIDFASSDVCAFNPRFPNCGPRLGDVLPGKYCEDEKYCLSVTIDIDSPRRTSVVSYIGYRMLFKFAGTGLAAGTTLVVDDCDEMREEKGGSDSQRNFSCVQWGEPGEKLGVLSDADGQEIFDFDVIALNPPPDSRSTALSCTGNTLGLPLDATSCYFDGQPLKEVRLKQGDRLVAKADLRDVEGGFCASTLFWRTPDNIPIDDWSFLFSATDSTSVSLEVERANGVVIAAGTHTASRTQFSVEIDSLDRFPLDGPRGSATLIAVPLDGEEPYEYQWRKAPTSPGQGINYSALSNNDEARLFLNSRYGSLQPIDLRVTDANGKIAQVQCLATVTHPPVDGDPAMNSSGSELLRGVDVISGNYHLSSTDLSVSGTGPDFVITRAYNASAESREGLGNWYFNLDMSLSNVAGSTSREYALYREDGRRQSWYRDFDNKFYPSNPGNFDDLIESPDGRFTLYTQGNLLYQFAEPASEDAGRLEQIADRDGNALVFSHDSDNRITGATDASGRAYSISRDGATGKITEVSDFTGRSVGYTWNASGMLTAVRNPLRNSTTYGYSDTRLTSITDPLGQRQATIDYCSSGFDCCFTNNARCLADANAWRVKSVTDGLGETWSYLYTNEPDSLKRLGTAVIRPTTNGVKNTVAFVIDAARTRLIERVDAENIGDFRSKKSYRMTTNRKRIAEMALIPRREQPSGAGTDVDFTKDGEGNPSQITDALNRSTGAAWGDIAGQTNLTPLTSVTRPGVATPTRYSGFTDSGKARTVQDPKGQITRRAYDATGRLTQSTDARGQKTDIAYDTAGRPTHVTDALGNVSITTYDDLGRVVSERNAGGHLTSYTYDANGNRLTTTDPAGGETTNIYDANDNLASTTDPLGNTTTYVYDILNRKIEERYSVGGQVRVRRFEYDAMGRLHRVINEKNQASETRFDARGKTLQEINPLSQTVTYTYDKNGNVLTVTDAEGRSITNEYDKLDRKTRTTDALGNYEQFSYNAQGLLASKRDARGQVTQYEYDVLGQMTKVTEPDGGVTRATYDANGNLATTTDRKGQTTTYTYDALNRLTRQTDAMGRQWNSTYDDNGNLLTRTTPSGDLTSYVYDNLDRVTSVTYPDGVTVAYAYDRNSNRRTMTDANGTTHYSYDEQNRLTAVTDAFGNDVAYGYDAAGLLNRLTYPGGQAVAYEHDAAGRLASLTDWLGQTTGYTRDKTGAVTAILYGNGARVQQGYDAAGRLISLNNRDAANAVISSHGLTLDGMGNPTSASLDLPLLPSNLGKAADMLYDASNRMTNVGGGAITHDADGRLTADVSGSAAIQYAYNARDLITRVTQGGTLTDSYVYDGDGRRVARISGGQTTRYVLDPTGGDLYSVLAETDGSNQVLRYYLYGEGLVSQIAGSDHRYYHFDQGGNTLALTDGRGVVTDRYAYEPFGNTTVQGSSYNPFRFVGKHGVMDDENGLLHMRARYYRPDLRRFLSLDVLNGQVTDPMTLNRYQYVSGNPMVGVDPSGEAADFSDISKINGSIEILTKNVININKLLNNAKNEESRSRLIKTRKIALLRLVRLNKYKKDMQINEGSIDYQSVGSVETGAGTTNKEAAPLLKLENPTPPKGWDTILSGVGNGNEGSDLSSNAIDSKSMSGSVTGSTSYDPQWGKGTDMKAVRIVYDVDCSDPSDASSAFCP